MDNGEVGGVCRWPGICNGTRGPGLGAPIVLGSVRDVVVFVGTDSGYYVAIFTAG